MPQNKAIPIPKDWKVGEPVPIPKGFTIGETSPETRGKTSEAGSLAREASLGFLSGISGLPESETPFSDAVRDYRKTATDPRNLIPVYGPLRLMHQAATGIGTSIGEAGKEILPVTPPAQAMRLLQGKTPVAEGGWERAAHGGGRLLGMGAQALLGTKVPEAEGESAIRKGVSSTFRKSVQGAAGAGRARVSNIMGQEARDANQAALEYHQASEASEIAGRRSDIAARDTWEAKKAKAEADYQAKAQEARQKWEEQTADVKAKNLEAEAKARTDYVGKLKEFDQASKNYGRRQVLERGKKELAEVIKGNVDSTLTTLEESLDRRWDELRKGLGEGTPIDSSKVIAAIKKAREQYLRGAPADLAEFDRLMSEMGFPRAEEQFAQAMEMDPTEMARRFPPNFMEMIGRQTSMDVGDALVHRSALGKRLASSATAGNVKVALGIVQDVLDDQIGTVARGRGMGGTYQKLLKDYRQYKQDWINMTPAGSHGGSFLARMAASTGPFSQSILEGKGYSDFLQRFSRYKVYGARPEAGEAFGRVQAEYKGIPKTKAPEKPSYVPPKRQALPGEPEVERPEIPPEPMAGERKLPKKREVTQRTPKEIREKLLGEWADRPFRWWEYGLVVSPIVHGYLSPLAIEPMLRMALRSPKFREWVASQPRVGAELPPVGSVKP